MPLCLGLAILMFLAAQRADRHFSRALDLSRERMQFLERPPSHTPVRARLEDLLQQSELTDRLATSARRLFYLIALLLACASLAQFWFLAVTPGSFLARMVDALATCALLASAAWLARDLKAAAGAAQDAADNAQRFEFLVAGGPRRPE